MFDKWVRFWFTPTAPTNLGVSRMVFFAGMLAIYAREDFSAWGGVSDAFWIPISLFSALHIKPVDPGTLTALQAIWRVALGLSAVGIATSASMAVSFVVGLYLLGLPHNFGQTYHFDAVLVIAIGILACSRAGDAWSVDAWLKGGGDAPPSGEYTWPVRAIWVAVSLVFFAAGLAKVRYGGLEWITSDNMSILLTRAMYHVSDADPLTRVGLAIANNHWLSSALAAAAVAIELGFPLTLISRKAQMVFVPAAFGMLLGIRVLMGPTFGGFLIAFVFWIPWQRIAVRVDARRYVRRRAGASRPVIDSQPD
jgi:hypothetical protein